MSPPTPVLFQPVIYTGTLPVKAECSIYEVTPWEYHTFPVRRDSKGRALGSAIQRLRCDLLPYKEEDYDFYKSYEYVKDPGLLGRGLFAVNVRATRDGGHFGAWTPTRYFKTVEEQEVYITKYLKAAQKRAWKTTKLPSSVGTTGSSASSTCGAVAATSCGTCAGT